MYLHNDTPPSSSPALHGDMGWLGSPEKGNSVYPPSYIMHIDPGENCRPHRQLTG